MAYENDKPFAGEAHRYWDRGLVAIPVKPGTKIPSITKWSSYQSNMPSDTRKADWIRKYGSHGIGILLGTEIIPGFQLSAIDVDEDKLVRAIRNFLGEVTPAKLGQKGLTFFVLVPKSDGLKSTVFKGRNGLGNVDILIGGRQTVMPPTIHPTTNEPYVCIGPELLYTDFESLPIIDKARMKHLKLAVQSDQAAELASGETTHEAGHTLVAQLISAGATDEDIITLVVGLLPEDYSGNSLEELPGWISSARQKGFDRVRAVVSHSGDLRRFALETPDWPEVIKSGKPKSTLINAICALIRLKITFSNDTFHNRKQVGGHLLQEFQGDLTDDISARIRRLVVDNFEFDPFKMHIQDAIQMLCIEYSHHPIEQYLSALEWDKIPRLETWLIDYMGAEDTALHRAIGKLMLVAAVRRIREPGCKFDTMVVFEGPQGTGKSTALSILAGEENFSDQSLFGQNPQQQAEALEGVWIYEVAELSGMRHADVTQVKAFITRTVDQLRPAYGRFKERWYRQCILVGTTNDEEYLKDETGNRRFLPVKTDVIDLENLKIDRDQLWAEAAKLEADGFAITLPKELWDAATEAQSKRMPTDPWDDALAGVKGHAVGGVERISTKALFVHLELSPAHQKDFHSKRLGSVMRRLSWEGPKTVRCDGASVRGYSRQVDGQDDA